MSFPGPSVPGCLTSAIPTPTEWIFAERNLPRVSSLEIVILTMNSRKDNTIRTAGVSAKPPNPASARRDLRLPQFPRQRQLGRYFSSTELVTL
jgi:hypothetical protein